MSIAVVFCFVNVLLGLNCDSLWEVSTYWIYWNGSLRAFSEIVIVLKYWLKMLHCHLYCNGLFQITVVSIMAKSIIACAPMQIYISHVFNLFHFERMVL